MSTNDSNPGQQPQDDEELSQLLDSALGDFGKNVPRPGAAVAGSSAAADSINMSDTATVPPPFDPEVAQQAAAEFQAMIRNLAEVQKAFMEKQMSEQQQQETGTADGTKSSADSLPLNEAEVLSNFLKNLNSLADKAQNVKEARSEDELQQAMDSFQNDTAYENELLPFMQGLVSNLLSKEMLYPSLKEMCEKYPAWLESNRSVLSPADVLRYEQQLGLMQCACREYEAEKDDDPNEVRSARFERLICCMQQMQACGQPPQELVGDMPPGWAIDELGFPKISDTNVAAESCSLM